MHLAGRIPFCAGAARGTGRAFSAAHFCESERAADANIDTAGASAAARKLGFAPPCGRMGMPNDRTGVAAFLASDPAHDFGAQTHNVDSGQWMS